MKWERVELGEVFSQIKNGKSIKQSKTKKGLPITRIETIWNGEIDSEKFGYAGIETTDGYEDSLLVEGDILMSHINSLKHLGKSASYKGIPKKLIHGMNLLRLRPKKDIILSKYAKYYFKSQNFHAQVLSISNQSVNQCSFSATKLKSLKIPLPPLPEQRRLAARLDKADALRQKSRAVVETYAELGRSVFLEVFGDPVRNERGWEVVEIGKISEVVTGNTPPRGNEEYYGDYIEWIKTDNINTPHMYLTEAKEFLSSKGAAKGRIASKNSILVTCIAGSPQVIGNAAIANRDVAFNQQINAMTEIRGNTAFFYYQLLASKQLIQSFSTNSMKGMISKSKFKKIPLINPPLDLQTRFAGMVANIEAQRRLAERQLEAAEAVFGGVLQGTFG